MYEIADAIREFLFEVLGPPMLIALLVVLLLALLSIPLALFYGRFIEPWWPFGNTARYRKEPID